jgi:N-methylhydantoinase A
VPDHVRGRFARTSLAAVVVPALASELSAFGAAASELRVSVSRDLPPTPLASALDDVNALLAELESSAREQMGAAFAPAEGRARLVVRRAVGVRYLRQLNLVDVPVDRASIRASDVPGLVADFRARYERLVGEGTSNADAPVEVVRVTVSIASLSPDVLPAQPKQHASPNAAPSSPGSRRAWFGGAWRDCPVHAWADLRPDDVVAGPAFIESAQTTVVVHDDLAATVDALGNVHLHLQPVR